MSPYAEIVTRLAATNVTPDAVDSVEVQYFLQTGNFNFHPAGPPQTLPAGGKFHDLIWPIEGIPDRTYVDGHGIDLLEHASGALVMDVDRIRALGRASTLNDCNANRIPDSCDIASGVMHDVDEDGFPDECTQAAAFRRGDSNADGGVNISDVISTLGCLFLGSACTLCPDSADADDSGNTDLSDAVYTLNNLFLGGPPLPAPGPARCGVDPTEDDLERCEYSAALCTG